MNCAVKIAFGILLTALIIGYVHHRLTPRVPFHMEGGADPKFAKVGRAFRTLVEDGLLGGSFAVYHKGKLVADVWGGYENIEKEIKWSEKTASILMSCTKGVAAICVGTLVDRGLLSYDEPVAKYWPEFAQNGKGKVTVRQLMRHEAGVVAVDEKIKLEDILSAPDKVGKILARQKPEWKLGEGHGYHMYSFGLYVDQLIRHADPRKRGIQQYFHEEISQPYDIDISIGLTDMHKNRLAVAHEQGVVDFIETITSGSGGQLLLFIQILYRPDSLPARANDLTEPNIFVDGWPNKPETLNLFKYPIASATGFGTARGLAKLYSLIVAGDSKTGKKLLSEKVVNEFKSANVRERDLVLGFNMSFSAGMMPMKSPKGTLTFGHPGFGGNFGYCDPEHQLSWSLVTSHHKLINIDRDVRYRTLLEAVYQSLDQQ